jgi:serine/threonine-protein kinase
MVDSYPVDTSPYGVRGMAGNVRDWCIDVGASEGPPVTGARVLPPVETETDADRVLRGGCWSDPVRLARLALRVGRGPGFRDVNLGFRLIREAQSRAGSPVGR